jgi:hypothetical protein
MRIVVLILVLLVCLATGAAADELPDAPSAARDLRATSPGDSDLTLLVVQPSLLQSPAATLLTAAEAPHKRKVMDRNFLLLGALTFGLAAADVELTQHCLNEKTCVELNPTLPRSRWGMYATNTPVNLAVMYFAYRRKAAGKGGWWIAPLIDAGIHGVGIGSNVRFVW